MAVANNEDGRLEAVWADAGTIMHAWQVAPNSSWSTPVPLTAPLGSPVAGDPLIELNGVGRLEVVVDTSTGTFNAWQVAPNSGWSEWSLIGPGMHRPSLSRFTDIIACAIPVASQGSGGPARDLPPYCHPYEPLRIDYGAALGGFLYSQMQTFPGGPWSSPAGFVADPFGAGPYNPVSFNAGYGHHTPFLAFASTSASMACTTTDLSAPTCSPTGAPPGGFKGGLPPVLGASANLDGRAELYALGADGGLWHTYQLLDWSFSGWDPMFAPVAYYPSAPALSGSPQAQRNVGGTIEIVMAGDDGSLWHTYQLVPNGVWGGWYELGPTGLAGSNTVALAMNEDGRLEAFAVSPTGQVTHTYQSGPSTGPWSPVIPL